MHLDYRLSEDWDENSINLAAADETDLRYYAATGDVILRNDRSDLSAKWGWIPLIDFALAWREIAEVLAVTESDATLRFERRGQEIIIRGSYASGEITVPFTEFGEQAQDFARRLDAELLAKCPELRRNSVYQDFKLSGLSP